MSPGIISVRRSLAAAAAVGLVALGAAATWLWMRPGGADADRATAPGSPAAFAAPPAGGSGPSQAEVAVSLTAEAIGRAGIRVSPVSRRAGASTVRTPGVVEPNAYRQVVVTPLVAGRVTRVAAELGAQVRQGQTLAQIYSPEIADAQAKFLSARAMLEAHDRELARTERLAAIGAASRQELERVHAEHTAQTSEVRTARARLELLGVPQAALDQSDRLTNPATADVPAPIAGIVTERAANIGLNVDLATKLFTVTDLSTVWVVAELYERDFERVRVGAKAEVTTPAAPGRRMEGRVGYIDPQMAVDTRTARVRVELSNPDQALRLGMYVDVVLSVPPASGPAGSAADESIVVPRTAVQTVGDRSVVYVEDPGEAGRFIERSVRLGPAAGDLVQVLEGLAAGDRIVVEGSFAVRAELERLGLRRSDAGERPPGPPGSPALAPAARLAQA